MFKDTDFEELDDHMENVEEETFDAAAAGVSTVSAPVSTAGVTISTVKPSTPPTTTTVFDNEDVTIAMAQTLIKMKEQKAKEKGVAITDIEDSSRIVRLVRSITTLQPLPTIDPKDKDKGVVVEQEPMKIKMRDQGDLQVQADAELAQRLHEEELVEKKQLAAARAEAIRNKLPTKTYVRNRMITYLKHMGKYTHQQLKNKTYEEIQRLYEKEKRWIDDFQPMDTKTIKDSEKKVDSSSKLAGGKEQESPKSDEEAAVDYQHEKEELRMWLTVVSDEEETMDPKILADGNTSYHKSLSSMLMIFDRLDLVVLHRLVMKRFKNTTPEGYNLLLWGDLKVMFEQNAEDEIWSNQQDWTLIIWKLYESCVVHTLLMDGTLTSFNMLVEKRYPLIKGMLQKMWNWKLEAEAESKMAFELLKFIKSQLEE
ncbi:hypothetical protein Tco_0661222 [Tanacetum coccineum]